VKTNRSKQGPRGRPRDAETHRRILATAFRLTQERGYTDVTIKDIAEVSKVSRQTIYRRWPTKEALFLEVVSAQVAQSTVATPSTSAGLEEYLRQLFTLARERTGDILTNILMNVQQDEVLTDDIREIINRRRFLLERAIERDARKHNYSYAVPITVIAEMLAAGMWYRWIYKIKPLDDDFAHTLVETVKALSIKGGYDERNK
jgi:AcrR family transcriptional regulator